MRVPSPCNGGSFASCLRHLGDLAPLPPVIEGGEQKHFVNILWIVQNRRPILSLRIRRRLSRNSATASPADFAASGNNKLSSAPLLPSDDASAIHTAALLTLRWS